MARDNIAPIAEEIIIEQQTIQELREQINSLQNELVEQKRHADKMDDLSWENLNAKKRLEKELEEKKKERERVQKELEKEKGWWDKWMGDPNEEYIENSYLKVEGWKNEPLQMALAKWMFTENIENKQNIKNVVFHIAETSGGNYRILFNEPLYQLKVHGDTDLQKAKQMIKHISEYYKWIYDYKK